MPELSMAKSIAWQESLLPIAGVQLRLRRAGNGRRCWCCTTTSARSSNCPSTTRSPSISAAAALAPGLRPLGAAGLDAQRARRRGGLPVACSRGRGLARAALLGLGFGGWIAAEMATMAPRAFRKLVLVGAMGIKPRAGRDRSTRRWSAYIDYARAGFHDQAAFDALYGADPSTDQLEQWDLNREMTFRIAWKPYMYNPTLPHLLGGVRTPTPGGVGRRGPHRAARVRRSATRRRCPRRASRSSTAAATASRWRSRRSWPSLVTAFAATRLSGRRRHAPHVLHRAADVRLPGGRRGGSSAPPR